MAEDLQEEARAYGLSLPGTREDFPWGERVLKVRDKVFAFLGKDLPEGVGLQLSVKLPESAVDALEGPHATPTGYGLGRAGWVSFRFPRGEEPDAQQVRDWLLESWRAVAPKRLVRELDGSR